MEDEIAVGGNGFNCPEELNEGGKCNEADLAIEVSTEVRKKTFRKGFEE